MIRYALVCDKEHAFEGWFGSSSAFDRQARLGQISCPRCGSSKVEKAPMTPNIATGRGERRPLPAAAARASELVQIARRIREYVMNNADYVGDRFAEEARRIHYEETERRNIYGEATMKEAVELREEGIECHPLPVLPEDHN